jgi:hypothetical protein
MFRKKGRHCKFQGVQKANQVPVQRERTLLTLSQSRKTEETVNCLMF